MNEFVEAAKKKAAEKKELRNKMRDEAMKFVDEYKKKWKQVFYFFKNSRWLYW